MLIALDFDGVIADGLNECLLIAWNTYHRRSIDEFNNEYMIKIPDDFRRIFKEFRPFIRHDGHFIVPFVYQNSDAINTALFDHLYSSITPKIKEEFRDHFINYRTLVRELYHPYWLSLHTLLLDIKKIMEYGHDIRIVSGKDVDSILAIFHANNTYLDAKLIYGRMMNKDSVLKELYDEAHIRKIEMLFIDDNLTNVVSAINLGINAIWAKWGYHTQSHLDEAKKHSIPSLEKKEFQTLIYSQR